MSECGDSNIKKSYIIQSVESVDIFSACTAVYTNQILPCSGNTVNISGNVNIIGNVSGNTFYGDGSNLTGITHTSDNFVSGGTFNDISKIIDFVGTDIATTFSVSLSALSTEDNYVSGGTYNTGTTSLDFVGTNTATTFSVNVSDLLDDTNSYVTDANWVSDTLTLTRNGGLSALTTTIPYFSGNTTGSCITNFHVTNIYGCSPITIHDQVNISGSTIFGSTLQIINTPTLNNSATEILSRNAITGNVEYRDVSSIINAASADTIVTGGTYVDGGSVYNSNSIDLNNNTGGTITITGVRDTYLTGQTFNNGDYNLTSTLNDGSNFISDLSILSTDMVVTGGTYNINSGVVTFTNNSGGTFEVSGFTSGMTDSYTTDANISASTESITFDNNLNGSNFYNVSLTPLLSGKTNNSNFNTYTSDTQTILNGKVGEGVNVGSGTGEIFSGKSGTTLNFRTLSGGSNTTLTTVGDVVKIDVAVPSGDNFFTTGGSVTQSATTGNTEITLQIVGNSGFTPYSITGITDTFVNDFTFSSNTFTISQNDGVTFDSSIETIELGNILSAVTFDIATSGSISATTFSGGTFYGDGSGLTGITDNDNYVTGGTFSSNTLTLNRQNGSVTITGFTSGMTDSYTTGATINNTSIQFDNNLLGLNYYNVDLLPLLSGKTNNTTFNTYTSDTQTILGSKISGATNLSTTGIFAQKNGEDLEFKGITSTGGTVTITNDSTTVNLDVTIPADTNTFVTGGTYSSGTTSLDFSGNTGFAPFSVNVGELIDDTNTFVTGFTYNDTNTFTISNNNDTNYSASIDIMSGLTVNGNSVFSGTGTDVVQIYGSGSTTPILRVEGSAGELFSITDSLTGELFAVNNISAETILSVNSDNTILWGDPTVPSLNTTVKKSINSGSTEIYSIPVSAYTGGFFEYTVTGAGARAGSIMSIFSGTSIDFNETTTNDIGDTSGITFDMNVSGGTANLTVSATTNTWEIRTIVRSI